MTDQLQWSYSTNEEMQASEDAGGQRCVDSWGNGYLCVISADVGGDNWGGQIQASKEEGRCSNTSSAVKYAPRDGKEYDTINHSTSRQDNHRPIPHKEI